MNKSIGVGRWVIGCGLIRLLLAGTAQAQYLFDSIDGVELKIL